MPTIYQISGIQYESNWTYTQAYRYGRAVGFAHWKEGVRECPWGLGPVRGFWHGWSEAQEECEEARDKEAAHANR